jgi:acetyltransferase-like isoleucine patch superfamily enzyme
VGAGPAGQDTFTCVVKTAGSSRRLRTVLWGSAGLLVLVAICGVTFQRSIVLEEQDETDEIMKPWEDGIYPARAHFPPGYRFGDDNTFGEGDTFAAGDSFGSGNTFGKNNRFGAGVIVGNANTFGKGASFKPGAEIGNKNLISDDASFAAGDVVGNENQFGRGVHFGKRVSIGHDNYFGTYNEFGRRDQFGARNIFGQGTIFGGDANFGKEQQFGSDITWDTTRDNENFQVRTRDTQYELTVRKYFPEGLTEIFVWKDSILFTEMSKRSLIARQGQACACVQT